MAILYTAFLIIATWKCYELIYIIPDKVMRWANAQGAQTDDAVLKSKAEEHGGAQQVHVPKGANLVHSAATGTIKPPTPPTPQG